LNFLTFGDILFLWIEYTRATIIGEKWGYLRKGNLGDSFLLYINVYKLR